MVWASMTGASTRGGGGGGGPETVQVGLLTPLLQQ